MIPYTISRWNNSDPIPTRGILLIRHGPREGGGNPSLVAELTLEGKRKCREFGTNWTVSPPSNILVSSVPRCVDTGLLIREAAGWEVEVEEYPLLGNPGPFVIDPESVIQSTKEDGDWSFLYRHIAGEEIPGMLQRDVGSRRMISELRKNVMDDGLLLAISHDSIIAALLSHGNCNPDPWPDPLCGAAILITHYSN